MPRYSDPAASRWLSWCPACLVGDCQRCHARHDQRPTALPCECPACPWLDPDLEAP